MIHKRTADGRQHIVDSMKEERKDSLPTIYYTLSTCKKEAGFTLVELMITMVIFVLFIAAASQVFTGLLTQFKQQSKIAETNIEGIVGLEILRQDIEHAGYGLPWNLMGATWGSLSNYNEAFSTGGSPNPADFNDGNPASALPIPANIQRAPRAVVSGNNTGLNSSDYLVIKSVIVARNFTAGKWQYLFYNASGGSLMKTWWSEVNEYVCRDDKGDHYPNARVIIISPGGTASNSESLVVSGGKFYTGADNYTDLPGFAPSAGDPENRIMYGVDPDTDLRMPFNRADYYIYTPANMPQRCAPNTGVLYKATLNHGATSASNQFNMLPLLDCVADMQVIFGLDNDNDGDFEIGGGSTDGYSEDISALTAQQVRNQVKQVRVYILAHEGQRDIYYNYPSTTISIGGDVGLGNTFNLATTIGNPEYKYYRWKLYTLVVTPNNLR
jgi:prepilin-type N-terminal cleavage/methylation domain-containing protein